MSTFFLSLRERRIVPPFFRAALVALVLVSAVTASGWAQTTTSPLVDYPVGDPIIYAAAAGLIGAGYALDARKPAPNISNLTTADIPAFDRLFYRTQRSEPLSIASDVTLAATALLPLAVAPQFSGKQIFRIGVIYAETLALSYGLKEVVKGLVVRYRPYAYASSVPASLLVGPGIENSFPSGHVTVAFAAAVSTGYIFDLYNKNTAARVAVWSSALGLATATAVFRVWSGNHFMSDVVAAAALGSLVGFIVPFVHSPPGLSSVGITPPIASITPMSGIPIFQYDIRLP